MKAFKILQVLHPRLLKVPTIHPPHCWGVPGPSGPKSLAKRPGWEPSPTPRNQQGPQGKNFVWMWPLSGPQQSLGVTAHCSALRRCWPGPTRPDNAEDHTAYNKCHCLF